MTVKEILDIIEVCPWRERREGPYVCTRFIHQNIPCDGACAWVVDYQKQKNSKQKNKYGT